MSKARSPWAGGLGGCVLAGALWFVVGSSFSGGGIIGGVLWLLALPVVLLGGGIYGWCAVRNAAREETDRGSTDVPGPAPTGGFPVVNPHARRD